MRGKKTHILRHFILKTIIYQGLGTNIGKTQKQMHFSQGVAIFVNVEVGPRTEMTEMVNRVPAQVRATLTLQLLATTVNCTIIAQFPIGNHSEQGNLQNCP